MHTFTSHIYKKQIFKRSSEKHIHANQITVEEEIDEKVMSIYCLLRFKVNWTQFYLLN